MKLSLQSIFVKFIIFLIIVSFLLIGFFIRIAKPNFALTDNVVAYYYDRANRLLHDGSLPPIDQWNFAPNLHLENIPPFLAYTTFYVYHLVNFFSNYLFNYKIDIHSFILFFPVLLYLVWAFLLLLILKSFSNFSLSAIIGLLIFIFSPISIFITSFARYTEESLGLFLFFISFWFFLKRKDGLLFYLLLLFSLTTLVLTWQQFHIFLIAMMIAIFFDFLKSPQSFTKKRFLYEISLFVVPILAGHLISRYLFGIAYSPIQMLKEFWIGLKDFHSEDLLTAMRRRDWAALPIIEAIKGIGLFGGILILFGMLRSFLGWKEKRYRYLLLFQALALFSAFSFSKNKAMLLPFGLYTAVIGWESICSRWAPPLDLWFKFLFGYLKKFFNFVKDKIKKRKKLFLFFSLSLLLIIFSFLFLYKKSPTEPPVLKIDLIEKPSRQEDKVAGKIKFILKNIGTDSLNIPEATAGIHIEVKNAEVSNIVGEQCGLKVYPLFKEDYSRGNVFWFEMVFKPLKKNEEVSIEFEIKQNQESEVKLTYRGWLPGFCPVELQKEVIKDLVGKFSNQKVGGWRHETCIVRDPPNNAGDFPYCLVEVFAAHKTLQSYRCRQLKI